MPAHCATAAAHTLLQQEKEVLREANDRAWKQPIRHKSEYSLLDQARLAAGAGYQYLARFDRALQFLVEKGGVRPGYLQHMFLATARAILLPRMFGGGIVSAAAELKRRYLIKQLYSIASIIFPRRSGKTTVQTILGAVVLVSQPDGNVVVFNLTARQSKAWLHQCIKWLELFKASPEFNYVELQRDMRETIQIKNSTGTTARLSSFAGGTTTTGGTAGTNLRGMGERIVLMMLDEFMFMQPSLYGAILPLLNNGAAMLLTSSMSASADDEIRRMLHAKMPDGREVVMRLDWIRACAECKANGTTDRCKHLRQRPQHFQRSVDQERVQALMRPFGEDAIDRELFNIGGRSNISAVFEREWLAPLKDRACDYRNTVGKDHRFFFVAIDPAGEGFSQNVIISATLEETAVPGNPAPYTFIVHVLSFIQFFYTGTTSMGSFCCSSCCCSSPSQGPSAGGGSRSCRKKNHQCRIKCTKSRVSVHSCRSLLALSSSSSWCRSAKSERSSVRATAKRSSA